MATPTRAPSGGDHTPDQRAEQVGHYEMHVSLKAMQQAPTQGERIHILEDALIAIAIYASKNPAAVAGAATALIAVLERGLKGLRL
ncbi:MAG: hypothetical protein K9K38_07605 [Rhodoferax sp.]|nr:hypothetical protein [Rhodoferax sp.]